MCTGISSVDDCDMFMKVGPGTGSSACNGNDAMHLSNWIELAWLLHHMIMFLVHCIASKIVTKRGKSNYTSGKMTIKC